MPYVIYVPSIFLSEFNGTMPSFTPIEDCSTYLLFILSDSETYSAISSAVTLYVFTLSLSTNMSVSNTDSLLGKSFILIFSVEIIA